jgi:hypothetical protein
MTRAGFPHSDILGSRFVCQLPEAYRRLQRPSSAPSAKASTLCPYKLDHKDHSKKMLASTVQFSSYDRDKHPTPAPTHTPMHQHQRVGGSTERYQPAATRTRHTPSGAHRVRSDPDETTFRLFPQDPTACPADPSPATIRSHPETRRPWRTRSPPARKPANSRCSTLEHRPPLVRQGQRAWTPPTTHDRRCGCQMLLRKEVIQPHLPVRLPCYDLVPIASPTFDSSLSYELGHWLRVLPTFVT